MAAFHPFQTFTRRRTVPKLSPPNGRRSSDDTSMGKDILLLGDGFSGCEPYPLNQAQKVAYSLGAGDPRSEAIRLLDGHDRNGSGFPLVLRTCTRLRSFELGGCLTHGAAFDPLRAFKRSTEKVLRRPCVEWLIRGLDNIGHRVAVRAAINLNDGQVAVVVREQDNLQRALVGQLEIRCVDGSIAAARAHKRGNVPSHRHSEAVASALAKLRELSPAKLRTETIWGWVAAPARDELLPELSTWGTVCHSPC